MTETPKDETTKAGDEILRRLLKTPPDPKLKKASGTKATKIPKH